MLTYLYILLCIFFVGLSYLRERKLISIATLFTVLWCAGGVVLENWHKLYPVEDFIHSYILIAIFSFNIVYLTTTKKNHEKFKPAWNLAESQYRLILFLHIFCYILMIPIFMMAISIIQNYGWFELRNNAYGESEIMSSFIFKLFTWFVSPIFTATIMVGVVVFLSNAKHSKILSIISCIDLILVTLSFGGRYAMVRMMIFILAAYFLFKHLSGLQYHIPLKYISLGCVAIYLLYLMTSNRGLSDLSFAENIMAYFFGSFVYMQTIITDPTFDSFHSQLQYGNETFGFITSLPQLLLYKITGVNNTPEFIADFASNDFVYIGPTIKYNATATALYPMWLDGREVGIVIGMAFLAYIYNRLRSLVVRKHSMLAYALLIYLIFVILTSTLTYALITVQHTIILFFIMLFTYKAEIVKS